MEHSVRNRRHHTPMGSDNPGWHSHRSYPRLRCSCGLAAAEAVRDCDGNWVV